MGQDSKISWCHHSLLGGVFLLVALLAERQSVACVVSKFREIGERLDVMRLEVTSARIVASLAGKAVPEKNIVAPLLVFPAEPLAATFGKFSVFVGVALRSSFRCLPHTFGHLSAFLCCAMCSLLLANKSRQPTHSLSSFHRVVFTSHGGWSVNSRMWRISTRTTFTGKSIAPTPVGHKLRFIQPFLAFCTSLFSAVPEGLKFLV